MITQPSLEPRRRRNDTTNVAKKIKKHVDSFPNLMDVISTFQRTAVERNTIPTPEENSLALMSYYENIVYLNLSAVS